MEWRDQISPASCPPTPYPHTYIEIINIYMEKQFKEKFKLKTDYYGGVIIHYDYCPSKKRKEPQGNFCSENRQFEDITRSLQPQRSLREKQSFLVSRRVRKYISVFRHLPRGVV